jgi:predicted transposase YbfD/YdcC
VRNAPEKLDYWDFLLPFTMSIIDSSSHAGENPMKIRTVEPRDQLQYSSLFRHFKNLKDPRKDEAIEHPLMLILFIFISAILSGANTIEEIHSFSVHKKVWLSKFFDLGPRLPSYATIRRVMSIISPKAFEKHFVAWINEVAESKRKKGEVIAFDGKAMRGSQKKRVKRPPFVLVNAFATDYNLFLGQIKVSEKSNEITALPELIESLMLEGCVVTIDAMGCQKKIAKKLVESKAEYLLGLKGNQESIHKDVKEFFEECEQSNFEGIEFTTTRTEDTGHGRIERRTVYAVASEPWIHNHYDWVGLQSVVMIVSERHVLGKQPTVERSFFLTSLPPDAERIGKVRRDHWKSENCGHYVLDIAFEEDASQIHDAQLAENMGRLRRIAFNLISSSGLKRKGMENERKTLAWNDERRERVMGIHS